MIGKTLAHYQILELLGKGGMAEVYRARDTRLDRDVALKILPPRFTSDPDRLRRFESEAKKIDPLSTRAAHWLTAVDMTKPSRRPRRRI